MRILNEDRNEAIKSVLLMLTINEASELRDSLESILSRGHHEHVNDQEVEHEITVAVYDLNPSSTFEITQFDKRVQKLILEDK